MTGQIALRGPSTEPQWRWLLTLLFHQCLRHVCFGYQSGPTRSAGCESIVGTAIEPQTMRRCSATSHRPHSRHAPAAGADADRRRRCRCSSSERRVAKRFGGRVGPAKWRRRKTTTRKTRKPSESPSDLALWRFGVRMKGLGSCERPAISSGYPCRPFWAM